MEFRLPDRARHLCFSIVPNLYGWIEVNGEPLEIYGQTETENRAIGYVEAQEGQQFIVHYADLRRIRPQDSYSLDLYVDGTRAQGYAIDRENVMYSLTPNHATRSGKFTGRLVSRTTEQPYLFGKLKTTDSDELACTDEQVVKNLGTLQLRYCRIKNAKPSTATKFQPAETKTIHEKAKKAQLSHQATYGESVEIAQRPRVTCDWIDSTSSPMFQLEFRYRSRQLLQLEGHIPNSPTPSPEPDASASPAATPSSPVSSTSNVRRSTSAAVQNSQSPRVESDEAARLARLQSELEFLRRQQQIATLEREINSLQHSIGSSENGAGEASSLNRKIKAEPSDAQRNAKKVKQEIGEASLSQSTGSSKGKGKEKKKKKAEVIVLSDSD
ncbi:hypothetical protein JCM5350_007898 [Sporobolomyces pararoseus]